MFEIEFYTNRRGDCPFETFLEGTGPKVRAKFVKVLDLLEAHGPELKRPYADVLRDGIYELRVRLGTNRYRGFFYYLVGKRIVVTHGIIKKTDEVPPGEIERALRLKLDFEARRPRRPVQEEAHAEDVQGVEGEGA
jgi:phage-related protein